MSKPEPGSEVTLTDGTQCKIVDYAYGRLNVEVDGVKKRLSMSLLPGWVDQKTVAIQGIPEEEINALRNVTLKEGTGVSFDMGLEKLEEVAQAIWGSQGLRTILVSNLDVDGTNQVSQYEGYGYVEVENGNKSRRTVPGRTWSRMACYQSDYDAREAERMRLHNSKHDLLGRMPMDGEPSEERMEGEKLDSILARADENHARVKAEKERIGVEGASERAFATT